LPKHPSDIDSDNDNDTNHQSSIMSDDEEEYEYDEDADDNEGDDNMDEDNQFEYTDDEQDQDDAEVALENAYYNSKGLRETNLEDAAQAFEQVIQQEQAELAKQGITNASGTPKLYGTWAFKAMKQLVKLHLRAGNAQEMLKHYNRWLECIAVGDASPNSVEKGVNGMLERVASLYIGSAKTTASSGTGGTGGGIIDPQQLALTVYDATLRVFHPEAGACKNERLWFKTNMKYGQLLYEMNETAKLQQVLKELQLIHPQEEDAANSMSGSSTGSSTQSLEIYALQIQLYSRQKDNKKLRETFNKAMVRD
jgi:COP9 signalosome complex subunit 2